VTERPRAFITVEKLFPKEIANDSSGSEVFTVIDELCIDMRRPQPRGR